MLVYFISQLTNTARRCIQHWSREINTEGFDADIVLARRETCVETSGQDYQCCEPRQKPRSRLWTSPSTLALQLWDLGDNEKSI